MNRIDDEPILFYLEHQDRIREWAALEAEVREFADRFYRSLKTDLDTALRNGRVEDDVELFFHEEGAWPGIALRRQSWPKDDEDPDVRLEWNRRKVCFAVDEDIYVGVRAKSHREVFAGETCPDYTGRPSSWWPVWAEIEGPSGRFWEGDGLEKYRHRLVDTVLSAWNDLAPLVDKAVGI